MSIEIAILLRRVLEIPYHNVAEIRILYNHNLKDHAYLGREYSIAEHISFFLSLFFFIFSIQVLGLLIW